MRLLLTRPVEDAAPLARRLRDDGHAVLLAPLLAIRDLADASLDIEGVQAVLLSSANGARALARAATASEAVLSLPVFAVGAASALAAREAGFDSVESAGGDVGDLAELASARLVPGDGALLHVAGSRRAGDLAADLGRRGFEVRRAVLYEAVAAETLPADCAAALAQDRLDAVLFFSPRTAATFARLVGDSGLRAACGSLAALCLSPAVAAELEGIRWRRIAVAGRPEQDHLLQLLREETQG